MEPGRQVDGDWFDRAATEGWHLEDLLDDSHNVPGCDLTDAETPLDRRLGRVRQDHASQPMGDRHLPGHPIWADAWLDFPEMKSASAGDAESVRDPRQGHHAGRRPRPAGVEASPPAKNYDLFARHFEAIIPWAHQWGVYTARFPPSRRKLEWQARTPSRCGTP